MDGEKPDTISGLAEEARGAFAPEAGGGKEGNIFRRGLNKLTGIVGRGAERIKPEGEALLDRMGSALERTKPFGRSVADFALRGAATGGLRLGAKELAKGIVSYSGLAGAVGGGLTGTIAAGAFVGAASGALVEYGRQVNRNLDQKLAGVKEADPKLVGRKEAFLQKMKEFRHTEVLKPSDWRKLGKAALFGAVAGAGAGALVEHIPELSEFVREHVGGLRSVASGAKDMAGNIPGVERTKEMVGGAWGVTGEAAGTVGKTAGDVVGGAGQLPGVEGVGDIAGGMGGAVGETAGTVGRTAGDILGGAKDMAGNIPGVQGAGDLAGNLKHVVGLDEVHEAGQQAVQTPEGFVPQADYDALQEHFTSQTQDLNQAHQTIDDLQRQLAEAKQALAAAKETAPVADVVGGAAAATETGAAAAAEAAEQAIAHAQSALDSFGDSIPLSAGSNPWYVSADILKQMGVDHPTPAQIMHLDRVILLENHLSAPEWGIAGTIDARQLPVGFNINLTDAVKKTALDIASKK